MFYGPTFDSYLFYLSVMLYCCIDFVNRNMAGVCWWKAKRTMLEESKYKEKRRKDVGGHSRTQKSEGKVLCVIASNSRRGWEKVDNSDRTESENERKEKNTEGRVMKSILGMGPKLKRRKDLTDRKKERDVQQALKLRLRPVELKVNSRWKQWSKLHWWGWGPRLLNWAVLHSPEKARVSGEDSQDVSVSRSLLTESWLYACALLWDGQLWSRCVLPKQRIFFFFFLHWVCRKLT